MRLSHFTSCNHAVKIHYRAKCKLTECWQTRQSRLLLVWNYWTTTVYWCLMLKWQRTEAAGRILKCIGILTAKIQPNGEKVDWAALHSTKEIIPKHTAKATQKFRVKKSGIFCNGQVNLLISADWACISLTEDKTKGRKTQKQTTTEVSCSKGLAKHHKGVNSVSGDAHKFQT